MNALMHQADDGVVSESCKYLAFRLGAEEYGIDILKVQEIRGYDAPTRVAGAPAFIKGVSNLRGTIVPVIDMRVRLGCANAEINHMTAVIILSLCKRMVGMVVDSVSDVIELGAQQLQPAPEVKGALDARSIQGLGSVGERMLILLDIEKLMAGPDMGLVDAA